MNFAAAKCPNCGGDIQVDRDRTNCFCMYCGSQIQVQTAINNISIDGVASAGATLTRGTQFLRVGQYDKAADYFARVLDLEPTNAQAFIGSLLASTRCNSLKNLNAYIEDSPQYKFALEWADESLREELILATQNARINFEHEVASSQGKQITGDYVYNFMWNVADTSFDPEEKPSELQYKTYRDFLVNWDRFDRINFPAVAIFNDDCSGIREVLPFLENIATKGVSGLIFVKSCTDELINILHMNCKRGIVHCCLICVSDSNKLTEIAEFCNSPTYSAGTSNGMCVEIKKAYVSKNTITICL